MQTIIARNPATSMPRFTINGTQADASWFSNTFLTQLGPASNRPSTYDAVTRLYGLGANVTVIFSDDVGVHGQIVAPRLDANGRATGGEVTITIWRLADIHTQPEQLAIMENALAHEFLHSKLGRHLWHFSKTPPSAAWIAADPVFQAAAAESYSRGVPYYDYALQRYVSPSGITSTQYLERVAAAYEQVYKAMPAGGPYGIPVGGRLFTEAEAFWSLHGERLGGLVGSTLGSYLAGGDTVKAIVYSSLLGEIGERLATSLTSGVRAEIGIVAANAGGLTAFGPDIATRMGQATIGSLSSLLTMELGEALGLKGFGAELFTTSGATVLGKALSNLTTPDVGPAGIFQGFRTTEIIDPVSNNPMMVGAELPGLLANAVGTFLGAKLGALVAAPQTQAGVALSSIGSAVGAYFAVNNIGVIGTAAQAVGALFTGKAVLVGNAIVPGIGAFVGFVLGSLIGDLFGRKRPTPTASAQTTLQIPFARYEYGAVTATGGGNVSLVTDMARVARDTLNGLIGMVAYDNNPLYVSNLNGSLTTQQYGHNAQGIYVTINGSSSYFTSADQAVELGTLTAIRNTKIIGGDILAKRVIARSPAATLTSLAGDLQIATDYRFYGQNRAFVDGLIRDAYGSLTASEQLAYTNNKALLDKVQTQGIGTLNGSEANTYSANQVTFDKIIKALDAQALANPWVIELERAVELNLDKFTASDFYGGLKGFIDSFRPEMTITAYEDFQLSASGSSLIITAAPNGQNGGLFSLLPTASSDGLSVTIENFLGSGLGYSDWDNSTGMAGNNYANYSSASGPMTIDDYGGSTAYSGGDDIAVGTAYGDYMLGRMGWDWLDGGGGNDIVIGGQNQDILLGGAGDDILEGANGDDYLSGGAGNDLHQGGDGNDVFSGKGGSDTMNGDNGDDTFVVNADGGAVYDWMDGGAGNDTLSFERFAGGVTVSLTSGSYYGDAWTSVENLKGGLGSDYLTGTAGDNWLAGGAGADSLIGGDGADTLEGGAGADQIAGGLGFDVISFEGSAQGVTVDINTLIGSEGDAAGDIYSSIEGIRGSRYSDKLTGNSLDNTIFGLDGDDWIIASAGADVLDGGSGLDFLDYSLGTTGVTAYLGSTLPTSPLGGWATGGFGLITSALSGIEGVKGTQFSDNLSGAGGDQVFAGGWGADFLAGGAGSDTYVFGRDDGQDTINDDGQDANVLRLHGVTYDQLYFNVGNPTSSTPDMIVMVLGTSDQVTISGNYRFDSYRNVVKFLNINGVGEINIGLIDHNIDGDDNGATHTGGYHYDWINGHGGNDTIQGGAAYEELGNVFIGGRGADSLTASAGDDQYVFEVGDGADTVNDNGGLDTLVFGPSVLADNVIYEVVADDLFIGLRSGSSTASQVADRIRVVGGGVRYINTVNDFRSWDTIDYVTVAGVSIDVTKLDIAWTDYLYEDHGLVGGNGLVAAGTVMPIVFDLDGDGLDLTQVSKSEMLVRGEDGRLANISWVGPTDGLLAVDRNKDGVIDRVSEISFMGDKGGAISDPVGLRGWDTNQDGVLDAKDDRWGDLVIWKDKNQNGQSSDGELFSLEKAGIASLDLRGRPTGRQGETAFDSLILNTIDVATTTGGTLTAFDVALATRGLESDHFDGFKLQGDGTFGVLLNDPKSEIRGGSRDRLSYDEVAAKAKLDFTGKDNAAGITRWERIKAQKRPGQILSDESVANFKALNDARVSKTNSTGEASRLALAVEPLAEVGSIHAGAATAAMDEEGRAAPRTSDTDAVEFIREGSGLLPTSSGASAGQDASSAGWWRAAAQGLGSPPTAAGTLSAGADNGSWEGARGGGAPPPIGNWREQQLLRQSLASFTGDGAGAGAPLWRQNDLQPRTDLLAGLALRSHSERATA